MSGLSPKLPTVPDENDGFALNKTYRAMVTQNFKNLMLTSPGEKVMDPEFGVGIKRYLFEQNDDSTYVEIKARILEQVKRYLPFIEIQDITFGGPSVGPGAVSPGMGGNFVSILVSFKILPLGLTETLKLP